MNIIDEVMEAALTWADLRRMPGHGDDARDSLHLAIAQALGKMYAQGCSDTWEHALSRQPVPNTQPARKIGGSYQADGAVVARFKTRTGLERVVFEFNEPKGMLHIFTPEQIEGAATMDAEPVAWCYQTISTSGTVGRELHLIRRPDGMDALSASRGAKAIPLYTHPPAPTRINVRCETEDGIGSTYLTPFAVDIEDDGSTTVCVKAWPNQSASTTPLTDEEIVNLSENCMGSVQFGGHEAMTPERIFDVVGFARAVIAAQEAKK